MGPIIRPNSDEKHPKVLDIRPFGSTILIEHLTKQEQMGTDLYVGDSADVGAPQAFVVAVGPKVEDTVGVKVGDRVVVQGTFIPVPNVTSNGRKRGIIEISNIKAIVVTE